MRWVRWRSGLGSLLWTALPFYPARLFHQSLGSEPGVVCREIMKPSLSSVLMSETADKDSGTWTEQEEPKNGLVLQRKLALAARIPKARPTFVGAVFTLS